MYQIELDRAKTNLTELIEIALRGEDIIITENQSIAFLSHSQSLNVFL
jgi:antitoxin (DNA-binding transcriptional repressor) of toxin-antitoxin stability system